MRIDRAHRTATYRIVRGKRHGWRGQALVEFALVAILFFSLVFALIDFSWMLFAQMSLQDAVREAARYASTGQHLPDPSNPGGTLSRIGSIQQVITSLDTGANISASDIVISSTNSAGVVTLNSAGAPGDTVTVMVTGQIPLLVGFIGNVFGTGTTYNFTAQTSFRNEQFNPAQTI